MLNSKKEILQKELENKLFELALSPKYQKEYYRISELANHSTDIDLIAREIFYFRNKLLDEPEIQIMLRKLTQLNFEDFIEIKTFGGSYSENN